MDFLLWTCLVLGLLGAISLALGGLGLESADTLSSGGDIGELADLIDPDQMEGITGVQDAIGSHIGDSHAALTDAVQAADLHHLSDMLDKVREGREDSYVEPERSMKPISSFTIFGFLTAFGLVGLALRFSNPGLPQAMLLTVAGASGMAIAWVLWRLLDRMLKFIETDSTLRDRDIIGALAEATMPIEVDGVGEVRIHAAGRLITGPARNTTAAPLERQEKVRIAGRDKGLYLLAALTPQDLEFLAALSALDATLAGDDALPPSTLVVPPTEETEAEDPPQQLTTE